MLTERMRDAMERANCSETDSEGERNRKKEEGRAGKDTFACLTKRQDRR